MAKATRFTTRTEIREALTSLLSDKLDFEGRVFPNRVRPVGVEELPVILVYPTSEDYTKLRQDPGVTLRRDLTIAVQIIASDSDEIIMSDALDDLADRIEDIVSDSDKLGGLVHDINIDTGQGSLQGDGQKPEGSWTLNYNVTYIKKPKE